MSILFIRLLVLLVHLVARLISALDTTNLFQSDWWEIIPDYNQSINLFSSLNISTLSIRRIPIDNTGIHSCYEYKLISKNNGSLIRNRKFCYPSIIVTGIRKCATTALYKLFSLYPSILTQSYKENCPFLDSVTITEYFDSLPATVSDGQVFIDGCVHLQGNMKMRAILHNPNVFYLVVVRDYSNWIWSAYNYWCNFDYDESCNKLGRAVKPGFHIRGPQLFHEIVVDSLNTSRNPLVPSPLFEKRPCIKAHTMYRHFVNVLWNEVGVESTQIISTEELEDHPERVWSKLSLAIGLDLNHPHMQGFQNVKYNTQANSHSKGENAKVRKDRYTSGLYSSSRFQPLLDETRNILDQCWVEDCKWSSLVTGHLYTACRENITLFNGVFNYDQTEGLHIKMNQNISQYIKQTTVQHQERTSLLDRYIRINFLSFRRSFPFLMKPAALCLSQVSKIKSQFYLGFSMKNPPFLPIISINDTSSMKYSVKKKKKQSSPFKVPGLTQSIPPPATKLRIFENAVLMIVTSYDDGIFLKALLKYSVGFESVLLWNGMQSTVKESSNHFSNEMQDDICQMDTTLVIITTIDELQVWQREIFRTFDTLPTYTTNDFPSVILRRNSIFLEDLQFIHANDLKIFSLIRKMHQNMVGVIGTSAFRSRPTETWLNSTNPIPNRIVFRYVALQNLFAFGCHEPTVRIFTRIVMVENDMLLSLLNQESFHQKRQPGSEERDGLSYFDWQNWHEVVYMKLKLGKEISNVMGLSMDLRFVFNATTISTSVPSMHSAETGHGRALQVFEFLHRHYSNHENFLSINMQKLTNSLDHFNLSIVTSLVQFIAVATNNYSPNITSKSVSLLQKNHALMSHTNLMSQDEIQSRIPCAIAILSAERTLQQFKQIMSKKLELSYSSIQLVCDVANYYLKQNEFPQATLPHLDTKFINYHCNRKDQNQLHSIQNSSKDIHNASKIHNALPQRIESWNERLCRIRYGNLSTIKYHHERIPSLLMGSTTWDLSIIRLIIEYSSGIVSGSLETNKQLLYLFKTERSCGFHQSVILGNISDGSIVPRVINPSSTNDKPLKVLKFPFEHVKRKCTRDGSIEYFDKAIVVVEDPLFIIWKKYQYLKKAKKQMSSPSHRRLGNQVRKNPVSSGYYLPRTVKTEIHESTPITKNEPKGLIGKNKERIDEDQNKLSIIAKETLSRLNESNLLLLRNESSLTEDEQILQITHRLFIRNEFIPKSILPWAGHGNITLISNAILLYPFLTLERNGKERTNGNDTTIGPSHEEDLNAIRLLLKNILLPNWDDESSRERIQCAYQSLVLNHDEDISPLLDRTLQPIAKMVHFFQKHPMIRLRIYEYLQEFVDQIKKELKWEVKTLII